MKVSGLSCKQGGYRQDLAVMDLTIQTWQWVSLMQESRPDRQEATSALPVDRGKFSNEARTALGSQIENADEATMERVSQLVQAHMVNGEDGDPELDMQVLRLQN